MKLLLVLPILLSGCTAEQASYPSLSPRAGEKAGFDEPAVSAQAPIAPDARLNAQVAEAARRLAVVSRGFDEDAAKARTAASAPGARTVGGEAWLSAQAAVAGLDDWRAQATAIASDLETAAGERLASAGTAYPALDALQARAAAEADREGAVIARLAAALPTP